jgi:hypothetical protein
MAERFFVSPAAPTLRWRGVGSVDGVVVMGDDISRH